MSTVYVNTMQTQCEHYWYLHTHSNSSKLSWPCTYCQWHAT